MKVVLCDVRETDLPVLYEQQLDPEATRMAAFPSRDREAFDAWKRILDDPTMWAGVARHNAGSIRVLEKCGFLGGGEEPEGDGMLLHELR